MFVEFNIHFTCLLKKVATARYSFIFHEHRHSIHEDNTQEFYEHLDFSLAPQHAFALVILSKVFCPKGSFV